MDFNFLIYIFFGVLPSIIWLSYYLRKDLHPEPKKMILKIFFWGVLITLPVFFVQIGAAYLLGKTHLGALATTLVYWFLIISLSEEFFKYLVVKMKVMNSPDLDEPLDIMLYMVVAALGFAALENILYLFAPIDQLSLNAVLSRTLLITIIRFIGATFLHTLCSAIIGYAIAISLLDEKNRILEATSGVIVAVLLHGFYDFSIMTLATPISVIIPVVIIITLAFIVFSGFERLKKLKGITRLNASYYKAKNK